MARQEKVTRLSRPENGRAGPDVPPYRPPFHQVLASLGFSEQELQAETINVSVPILLRVLAEAFATAEVDEGWYLDRYPDVHAAILAGRTPSAAAHFRAAGYREGRLPGPLPFDPEFYFDTYKDLATTFDRTDAEGLRHHYETQGYLEGRAGVRSHFHDAGRFTGGPTRD